MIVLALDTSTLRAAVALGGPDGRAVAVAPPEAARRHASGLVPAIRDLLRGAGISARDLDALAVGLGPGSFTGLRVGLAAAKAIAYATGRPLLGLDSLEAIARNAPADAVRVRVVVDAQRGELFAADFAQDPVGSPPRRLGQTRLVPVDDWLAECRDGDLALGPALERPKFSLPPLLRRPDDPADDFPAGNALLALAAEALADGRQADPFTIEPVYLRRSAAEEKADPTGPRTAAEAP